MRSLQIIFSLWPAFLLAQEKPIKWGEVAKADLEMTTFPADTNAYRRLRFTFIFRPRS